MADAIEQALESALEQHRAGNLQEAERIYRGVLQAEPEDVDALHLLGLIAHQTGRHGDAAELIGRAVALEPGDAVFRSSLGKALEAQGQVAAAVEAFGEAVRLAPEDGEAWEHLGNGLLRLGRYAEAAGAFRGLLKVRPELAEGYTNLGTALQMQGAMGEAIAAYERALVLRPEMAEAHNNLGNALKEQGRLEEASAAFGRALALRPGYAEAQSNLGNTLQAQGKLEEAVAAYEAALRMRPELVETLNNLGNALQSEGKVGEAIEVYRKALRLRPAYAAAHNNLGNALQSQERWEEAEGAFREAIRLRPAYAEGYSNLANALHAQGELAEAVAASREALRIRPGYGQAYGSLGNALLAQGKVEEAVGALQEAARLSPQVAEAQTNLGNALQAQGKLDEAEAVHRRAVALKPGFVGGLNNLGTALKESGRLEEAIACYEQAVALKPGFDAAHSNLLYLLYFLRGQDGGSIAAAHRRWNRECAEPLNGLVRPHGNDRDPERRLRVGYVSPDFRNHCQSLFTLPVLRAHDRERFEVFCYADVIKPDGVTGRLRGHADVWRETAGVSDEGVAEMVRADGIDILVDLTMHMAKSRLLAFARRPAPVQVTWLAYPGTTGLEAMGYRLTDPYLDPVGQGDGDYTERSIRLPQSFWCFDPSGMDAGAGSGGLAVGPLPAEANGYVTFGCLNNFCKINEGVLALWGRVMRAAEGSRLMLLAPQGRAREGVAEALGRQGVARERVEFVDRLPREKYMALYQRMDVALDTVPYNGHTTSLDGLWMGVPVVSRVGETAVGRGGLSILSNAGLGELVARTDEGFVEIAVKLAGDLRRLAELRAGLRERMKASPLMDEVGFTRGLEAVYREIWRAWCRGG